MVLLVVMMMRNDAYGVSIHQAYVEHTGHQLSLSAVHTVLRRLEKKGLISSEMGGATTDRGGRRKRLYSVTAYGQKVAAEQEAQRQKIWRLIPKWD